jgi:hypothetical protein
MGCILREAAVARISGRSIRPFRFRPAAPPHPARLWLKVAGYRRIKPVRPAAPDCRKNRPLFKEI